MAAPIKFLSTNLTRFSRKCLLAGFTESLHVPCRRKCSAYEYLWETIVIPHPQVNRTNRAIQISENLKDESRKASRKSIFAVLAISLFKKKEELSTNEELIMTLKYAKLAEHKQDFKRANSLYHQALALVVKLEETQEWDAEKCVQARVHIYDNMANMNMSIGRYDSAEKLFKESMRGLLQKGVPQTENSMIEISLKLAMVYSMTSRPKEAENGYQFCMDTLETKLKDRSLLEREDTVALLGMVVNSYSRFLYIQDRLPEAQVAIEKAIVAAQEVFPDDHPQLAVLYNDLGTMASEQGKMNLAFEAVERAIDIGKKTSSSEIAVFLCNLGKIHLLKGNFSEALQYCKEALALARKLDDKDTQQIAREVLKDIAEEKKKRKQYL